MKNTKCLEREVLTSATNFGQVRIMLLASTDPDFKRYFIRIRNKEVVFISDMLHEEKLAREKFTETCNRFIEKGYRK
jgi:hypothetical protein